MNATTIALAAVILMAGMESVSHEEEVTGVEVKGIGISFPEVSGILISGNNDKEYRIETEGISVSIVEVTGQPVQSFDSDLASGIFHQKEFNTLMSDKRGAIYERFTHGKKDSLNKWKKIYQENEDDKKLPTPRKLDKSLRMIAELRSIDHAVENLAFYKDKGYDSVLIAVREGDSLDKLRRLVFAIRSAGMSPFFAWSGPESLDASVYPDPVKLESQLCTMAFLCDGFLTAWRRTSAHLLEQDKQYIKWMCSVVLSANPSIYIIGEAYWGETYSNDDGKQRDWKIRHNAPPEVSATMIVGIGVNYMPVDAGVELFMRDTTGPYIGMVLGPFPRYGKYAGWSFEKAFAIKKNLEQKFIDSGCLATITLHGDMSDRGDTLLTTDDIGAFRIK